MVSTAPEIVCLFKNVLCYSTYSRWLSISISKPCEELATVSVSDHRAEHMQRSDTDTARERVHDTDAATAKDQEIVHIPHCQPPAVDYVSE